MFFNFLIFLHNSILYTSNIRKIIRKIESFYRNFGSIRKGTETAICLIISSVISLVYNNKQRNYG